VIRVVVEAATRVMWLARFLTRRNELRRDLCPSKRLLERKTTKQKWRRRESRVYPSLAEVSYPGSAGSAGVNSRRRDRLARSALPRSQVVLVVHKDFRNSWTAYVVSAVCSYSCVKAPHADSRFSQIISALSAKTSTLTSMWWAC
jgi:hypothetical protein